MTEEDPKLWRMRAGLESMCEALESLKGAYFPGAQVGEPAEQEDPQNRVVAWLDVPRIDKTENVRIHATLTVQWDTKAVWFRLDVPDAHQCEAAERVEFNEFPTWFGTEQVEKCLGKMVAEFRKKGWLIEAKGP